MSIKINYKGRSGNNIFQYIFARILAEKNDFKLDTEFPQQHLLGVTEYRGKKSFLSPEIQVSESPGENQYNDLMKLINSPLRPGKYLINGYFEYPDFYLKNRNQVLGFFDLPQIKKNTDDIVINLRLGDFATHGGGRILHPSWYLYILERETFKKVYIVGAKPDEPYLKYFADYQPIVVPNDPIQDFHTIRSFDKIICSNSTYAWWAAFLSDATTIYYSDKFLSPNLSNGYNATIIPARFIKNYSTKTFYPWQSRFKQFHRRYIKAITRTIRKKLGLYNQ